MKTLTNSLHHKVLVAALPVALTLAGCGKDDPAVTPTPEQGKVMLVHAAAAANVPVKVVANDNKELGQLNYGQSSGYNNVFAGSQSFRINDASSNQTIVTQTASIEKDKNYSVFAYSPTTNLGSAAALVTTDDLTAPAPGKAKIRIVHLGVSAPTPVSLSLPAPTTGTIDIIPNVAFGTASAFVELAPNPYNLAISTGSGATGVIEVSVGDGTGSSPASGTKTYAAGKIYTILVRGIKSTSVPQDLRLKAVVIENN